MANNSGKFNLLIVDDEEEYRDSLRIILESEGYLVDDAASGEVALDMLKSKDYDLVLTDLMMKGIDGIELVVKIKAVKPHMDVIIITGYGSIKNAVEAMKKGAFSYFVKGHDPEELIIEIEKLRKLKELERENSIYREQNKELDFMLDTKSPKFKRAIEIAQKAAVSNVNILILGESGVGKEVFAKYIHSCSERKEGHFIAVNCHALSESLLESELFGHEKGAFTGAMEKKKGKFEAAHDGTLFLDEIGDATLSTQVKLLRTIENKRIERIGSNRSIDVNFRLVCATNKELEKAIREGEFREDLFYRISTITIEIPPLRERKEDIPKLIEFFFGKSKVEMKKDITEIEEGVMNFLILHDYPGNVRELKNIVERLVVLSEGGVVREADIPRSKMKADDNYSPDGIN
ncbi:DNA-binding transcriptional response regulator, NtrC family, contains REC, AAA-type ATPase, and a Fis-type DNA-binding domains [Peptoclostridium litorale DSM 5388]|uniref:Stage 0 sporulation protein A homolog n=1 Tax=Peptoclostridium litorale DSM 5388 TaxID=1121324 RepID=A0A069RE12_PEPLI|nr:sigma-54 dependent transcriptional regulator [Peptoclostridium litorale]KDR94983.1 transcriptional regulatory protein QseF [Peptoclostridium litorale DSM 5388]SIN77081.1 DNA-binding transcriptional response regulator, NtrC family, contains REC, AAA-type ATPase, and a Fis-type DNA-binding domains [Peptoclostridium litorale DSM 5388]